MVPRTVYLTVDFSYLNVSNNKKKLVTATGEQRHTVLPPQTELLVEVTGKWDPGSFGH